MEVGILEYRRNRPRHDKLPPGHTSPVEIRCPRCSEPMAPKVMRTAIWQGARVAIVEDIPAHVCETCSEQWYDGPVSEALRRLAEDGFPPHAAKTRISVPVFSLSGRVKRPAALPEDVHVD